MENQFLDSVKNAVKYWWSSLLLGILAIILGIWAVATPDVTLVTLSYLFVWAFFIGGILEIVFAVSNKNMLSGWGWTLSSGIIDILFSILLMAMPLPVITTIFIYVIGFWIMFRSMWTIGESVELQKLGVPGWGWMLALGILSVLFSILFIMSPIFSGAFIVVLVSIALIIYGIFRIYLSFKLKSIHKYIKKIE